MEIILKRKVVFERNSEGLYGIRPWRKFLTKKEIDRDNEHCDVDVYTDSHTDADSKDIPIEDMKAWIQKAEDAGANYIQIDWRYDHEEYNIYGSRISRMTDAEAAKLEAKEVAKAEQLKNARIQSLEEELKQLKTQK